MLVLTQVSSTETQRLRVLLPDPQTRSRAQAIGSARQTTRHAAPALEVAAGDRDRQEGADISCSVLSTATPP